MTQLEVQLTADIKRLKAQLNVANRELRRFGTQADKQGAAANRGFQRAGKGAANVTPTLLEFNRVVQDAPFGIQGVANNIQQLTANFGNLSRSAGGTLPALRSMFGALAGPTGILLAVSTITSLLVAFGDKLKFAASQTSKLAEATKEYLADARTEVEVLGTLVNIANNENLSKKARLGAIERINKKYSSYLGNLDLEKIKTKETRQQIDLLTSSLIKQAQARGAQELIQQQFNEDAEELGKLILEQRNASASLNKELERLRGIDAFRNISGSQKEQIKQIKDIVRANNGLGQSYLVTLNAATTKLVDAQNATKDFKKEIESNLAPVKALFESLTIDSLLSELKAADDFDGKEVILTATTNKEQVKQDARDTASVFQDEFASAFGARTLSTGEISNIFGGFEPKQVDGKLTQIEDRFSTFKERLASSTLDLASAVGSGFAQLGQSLAQGSNAFSAVGTAILSVMGDIATQLGQAAIASGVAGIALQNLFKNPYLSVAAGGALVAIGAALKSAQGAVSGIGRGGGGNIGGQGSPSRGFSQSVGSASSGFGDGTVVFEIQGQSLVGVLQRTLGKNARLGGNLTIG